MSANGTAAERQRWEELITDLLAEAETASDVTTKIECLREAALMCESQLGEPAKALLAWQAAFAEQPGNEEAALALERLAEALDSWHTVLPECEALLASTEDGARRAALLVWMARWLERFVGDDEAAERRLVEAATLQPGSIAAAEALSSLYSGRGEWARAAEALERAGRATGDVDEAVGMLLEAARLVQARLGDSGRAAALYRRVLELSPTNAVAAEGLAEVAGHDADPAVLCAQYRQQLETDPDNLAVLRRWADLAFEHGRWDDVRLLFERLFERVGGGEVPRPDRRARLVEALDRFVAGRKWAEAIDVLRTLATDAEGAVRAKYYLTAGKIAQHELANEELAAELFDLSLDTNPDDQKTFERLYAMLSARRAWPQAERAVRRMIERQKAPGRPAPDIPLMINLHRKLGDVYRLGLRDLAAAAQAYEECARLSPADQRYAKLVAELTGRAAALTPPRAP